MNNNPHLQTLSSSTSSSSTQKPAPPIPLPPCTWPRTPITYILLFLLTTQAILCLTDASTHLWPLHLLTVPLQALLLRLFHTHSALRLFFAGTLLVHLLEAAYAYRLIRRATQGQASFTHTLAWIVQTLIIGFPSLVLLMRLLASHPHSI